MKLSQLLVTEHLVGVVACIGALGAAGWLARNELGTTTASAELIPLEHKLASTETGRLKAVLITAGQSVKTGDVVARLDTTILEHEIRVAESRLRGLGAEPAAAAAALDAELNTDGFATERGFQGDFAQAQADLAAAQQAQAAQEGELRSLREEIARQRQLVKDGLTRAQRAEELELQARNLTQTVSGWRARIESIRTRQQQAESRLREWQATHASVSTPDVKRVRLQPARSRLSEQEAAIQLLRARLDATVLRAPADGVVLSVLARPGDVVTPGVPFAALHASGTRTLRAYVTERAHFPVGTLALARRRSAPYDEWPAKVVQSGDSVVPIPTRFWQIPTAPQWGREVVLELPASAQLDNGEAVDVRFPAHSEVKP